LRAGSRKTDLIYETLRDHCADDRAWHERIDERLRKIEERSAHSAGGQSVIRAFTSAVVAGIVAWTAKHFT
jgi:hypothetical protein